MSTSGDGHVCSICGRLFTNSKDLTDHKRYHEDDEQKCDICDKMFKNKTILAAHKRLQHPVAIVTYTCNVCNKILTKILTYPNKYIRDVPHENSNRAHYVLTCRFCISAVT